jgi:drug/metabolite transporter (DMT)-like permease
MISLLFCIFCSTLLVVLLKVFAIYKIPLLQALIFNYLTASILGFTLNEWATPFGDIITADWSKTALILGIGFIGIFYLTGLTAKNVGISITSVANKMSLIIPVLVAYILYDDSMGWLKIIGILLALVGIYLSSTKKGKLSFPAKYIWLPLLVFVGSGILDTLVNFAKKQQLTESDEVVFSSFIFSVAGSVGMVIWLTMVASGKDRFNWKAMVGGIALGVPNFGSIYFMLKAFAIPNWESSQVIPVINMGIVLASALAGMLFFKEKLGKTNWIGILIAAVSIGLISGAFI